MKTTSKITIATIALSIIASNSLWAAPSSKQIAESPTPRHEAKGCTKVEKNDTAKKPTGPASKRF